jgi:hypothetical protein
LLKKHVFVLILVVFSGYVPAAVPFFPYDIYYCGARGFAAGGAYVSLADDTSAVFWNPAGLVQQKKPVLTYLLDTKFILNNIRDPLNSVFKVTYIPGLISFIWPFNNLHKMVIGIAEFTPVQRKVDNDFNIYEIALPFAFMPIPRLAVGLSPALMLGSTMVSIPTGFGFQAGLLYTITEQLRWGLVFRAPFTMSWQLDNVQERFPMVIQTGISMQLNDNLSIAGDMEYQDWPGISYSGSGTSGTQPDFPTGFLYTWVPHFGIKYNDDRTGAHLSLGYMGRPFMDRDAGGIIMKPQHLLTFGITGIAERINLTVDVALVDSYLLHFLYDAPSFQEIIQISVEYRFERQE